MTDLPTDLTERLRELDAKANPAPWKPDSYNAVRGKTEMITNCRGDYENHLATVFEERDRDLVIELRNNVQLIISSLEELSRLKAGEGWRDMQSAPRDGSMFLMGYVGHPEWGTKVCMRKVQHLRTDAGFEVKDLGSWALVNGIDDDLAETDSTSGNPEWSTAPDAYNDMATWHWRPLPPAPGGRSDG